MEIKDVRKFKISIQCLSKSIIFGFGLPDQIIIVKIIKNITKLKWIKLKK